jgi:transcriptional regulator with GAF, ATPase, and Fis domain
MADENIINPPAELVVTGDGHRRSVLLTEEPTLIGRGSDCNIKLKGRAISRHHCQLNWQEGRFVIEDLQSLNGTFVDGNRVESHPLTGGESISIGPYTISFRLIDPDKADDLQLPIDVVPAIPESTITLSPENTPLLMPVDDTENIRLTRNLQALLRIGMDLNSYQTLGVLQQNLLKSVMDVAPATYAMLIFARSSEDAAPSFFTEPADLPNPQSYRPSRTVTARVLSDRVALMSNEPDLEFYEVAGSPEHSDAVSILAVPLFTPEQTLGLIYVVNTNPRIRFEKSHLELVTAIAGIVSPSIEKLRRLQSLESENRRLAEAYTIGNGLIGNSPGMLSIHRFIDKVAPFNSTVMLYGETGTGKELVAKAIHARSPRANRPLVAINSAGLVDGLLESELFGHEKGAFTTALHEKKGKLEIADGGTLFLDEVGDMPPQLQVKLLRVLQEREFERVGGVKPIKTDIRIIAATNRNLEEAVAQKLFRPDLYFRLNVVSVTIPPLRERGSDIELLASHFVRFYSNYSGRKIAGIAPEALEALAAYDWPGNIRELQGVIEKAVVFGSSDHLEADDLSEKVWNGARRKASNATTMVFNTERGNTGSANSGRGIKLSEAAREAKKQKILSTIELVDGNITQAANLLNILPPNLHRLIRQLGLREEVDRIVGRLPLRSSTEF